MAYLILQITIGKPMYFMEMAMGQYSGKGPVRVWGMNPAARAPVVFLQNQFLMMMMMIITMMMMMIMMTTTTMMMMVMMMMMIAGIGFSMCLVSFVITVYYNVLMAYILHYFFASLQTTLPWSECKPTWKNCITDRTKLTNITICRADSKPASKCTCSGDETIDHYLGFQCVPRQRSASDIYFYDEVIAQAKSLALEEMGTPSLSLSLTLILSWVIVIACVIKGVKSTGKVVYFTATFPYVVLLILLIRGATLEGASKGVKFFIVPEWDQLGNVQRARSTPALDYGLAFVAYPEALSQLPVPQLWSALFFIMLLTLGLDSEFALFETFLTYLEDDFRPLRRHKLTLRLGLGLGGIYLITIFDYYGAAYSLIALSGFEVVSVMWVYGIGRFLEDCEYMLGKKPKFIPFWYFTLGFWSPLVMNSMAVISLVLSETPKYSTGRKFTPAVMVACWGVYLIVMAPVPLWFFLHVAAIYRKHGYTSFWEFMQLLGKPTHRWGPADGSHPMATKRLDSVWADVCPGTCGHPVTAADADSTKRRASKVNFAGN
nr:hypothetical protein BaRGS_031083 [Batillaria attramentaria]